MSNDEKMGVYIFCGIQTDGEEQDFGSVLIEGEERKLYTLHYKDAGIVAADAPVKIYRPSKENLLMHQNAVSLVMKKNDTVIPVSFGNVFHSRGDAEVLLENLYPQFSELFPAIQGKVELGLKVVGKKDWLESQVAGNAKIEKMAQAVKGKSEAASYYERIQLGGAAEKIVTSLQRDIKQQILQPLGEIAEASRANDPIGEKMLLNAAFLVDRDKEKDFDEKVNELHEEWKDKAEFSYSGPWAAYNFVNIRLKVEEAQ